MCVRRVIEVSFLCFYSLVPISDKKSLESLPRFRDFAHETRRRSAILQTSTMLGSLLRVGVAILLLVGCVNTVGPGQHSCGLVSQFGRPYTPGVGDTSLWALVQTRLAANPTVRDIQLARDFSVHPSTIKKIRDAWKNGQVGPRLRGKQSESYRYVYNCMTSMSGILYVVIIT